MYLTLLKDVFDREKKDELKQRTHLSEGLDSDVGAKAESTAAKRNFGYFVLCRTS